MTGLNTLYECSATLYRHHRLPCDKQLQALCLVNRGQLRRLKRAASAKFAAAAQVEVHNTQNVNR